MKKILVTVFLIIIVLAITGVSGFFLANRPADKNGQEMLFTIDPGESFGITALKLEQLGIVRSAVILRVISRITGQQSQIQSGTFVISSSMTSLRILKELVSGKQILYKITIPEGYTINKIAAILQLERICNSRDFIEAAHNKDLLDKLGISADSAEGYLFPDTYMFPHDYPAEKAVNYMVKNFHSKMESVFPDYKNLSPEELQDKIILASIVEREYRIPEEAPKMASVFYNRLKINHRLESCATVVYILTELLGRDNPEGAITFADTKINSPYNTYLFGGLPPGPISNPGSIALGAVFSPADTDYMFFRIIEAGAGRHYFSRTYEEHLNAYEFSIKAY